MLSENILVSQVGNDLVISNKSLDKIYSTFTVPSASLGSATISSFKLDMTNNVIFVHYSNNLNPTLTTSMNAIKKLAIIESLDSKGEKVYSFSELYSKVMHTIGVDGKNRSIISDFDIMSDGSVAGIAKTSQAGTDYPAYAVFLFRIMPDGTYLEKRISKTDGTLEYLYGRTVAKTIDKLESFLFVNTSNDDVILLLTNTGAAVNPTDPLYFGEQIVKFDKTLTYKESSRPYPNSISYRFLDGTARNIKTAAIDFKENQLVYLAHTDLTMVKVNLGKINEAVTYELDKFYSTTFSTDTYFFTDNVTKRTFILKNNTNQLFPIDNYLTVAERSGELAINLLGGKFFFSDIDDMVYTYTKNLISDEVEITIMSASNEEEYRGSLATVSDIPSFTLMLPKTGVRIPNGVTASTLMYPRSASELFTDTPTFIFKVGVAKYPYITQQFRLVIDTDYNKILGGSFDDTYLLSVDSYASGSNFESSIVWSFCSDFDPYLGLSDDNGTWQVLGTSDGKISGGVEPTNGIKTSLSVPKYVKVSLNTSKKLPEVNKNYYFRLFSYSKTN